MNELANQRQVLQKIDGWKVYHLSTQMESMVETEVEFAKKLNALHKVGWFALSLVLIQVKKSCHIFRVFTNLCPETKMYRSLDTTKVCLSHGESRFVL